MGALCFPTSQLFFCENSDYSIGASPLLSECPSTKKEICFRAFSGGVSQEELHENEELKKLKEKNKELETR